MSAQAQLRVAALGAATLFLFLLLIQPNHPHAVGWGALLVFPLELPIILLALIALPADGRASRALRLALVITLSLIALLKTADFVSFNALSRGFNPVADFALIDAFIRLLSGTFGVLGTSALVVLAACALVGLACAIWWATGVWAQVSVPRKPALAASGVATVFALLMVAQINQAMGRWVPPLDPPGTAFTARVAVERWEMVRTTLGQLRRFNALAAQDPFAEERDLLGAIDRDVLIVFVESYGRTSHDTAYFAQMHRPTLQRYETALADNGLAMRSGFLEAPTRGGQSWLSHATLANGLWVDNQMSYGAALASGRRTLFHYAATAGFHTAAVMPQITLDWPESAQMGFDTILAFDDLGYAGPAFNWVTMPDQFTLSALDRLLRTDRGDAHAFIQVALVSSHAPWVPVPKILPWDTLGNGAVFASFLEDAETPREVWRDRDRVRMQYRLAVDYALQSVFEYALLHADDPPLLIVVGDHQAAEFVALDDRPHVPVHVVGPSGLVDRLKDVAPAPGLLPTEDTPVVPMDAVRDAFLSAFSNPLLVGGVP
ncbi:MAG: hypothetical protein KI785_03285 [Devosiaceae bacterium]|nr:hypothetical protein [Devosiaceae bacterium MH13]